MKDWIPLLTSLALCALIAALGGRWTAREVPGWYVGLRKPSWTPPRWLFAPAWTLLYALMAVAAWRIWLQPPSPARSVALAAYAVQLALNLAWSWIFFHRHAIGAALAEIALLWTAIGLCLGAFARVEALAAWLLAPYWAWVSFAALLNASLWRRNRGAIGGDEPHG